MLHASTVVIVDVFFDLGLFLAFGGFIDGHFDDFVGGGHNDAFKGGEFAAFISVVLML